MIAGQYAFEQVKLDRKGYDTRRLQKYLSFLADAAPTSPKKRLFSALMI